MAPDIDPYHGPEQKRTSTVWAKILPEHRELYPWVDPDTWYPAQPGQPGLGVVQLLTKYGPRMVYERHFEVRREAMAAGGGGDGGGSGGQ